LFTSIVLLALTAAPPLRLSALLEDARQRNPELRAALAQARAAASSVSPAGAFDDPTLMVQYWNGPVDFSVVPIMVQLTQTIPLGGKLGAKSDAAAADARMAQAEASTRLQDVERDVTRAFVDLFVAERTLVIHDEMLGVLRTLSSVTTSRVGAGRAEVVDQLKAQAELLKEEGVHESLLAEQTTARVRLAALLNRGPSELAGEAEEPLALPSIPADEELLARAIQERPELHAAASATQAAEARTRLATAAGVPDITPLVAYMHTFNMPPQNNFLFFGVQANLPIWRGSKIDPAVEAARARVEATQALAEALRDRIRAQVLSAAAQLRAEQRLVGIQRRLVPLSRQALDSAVSAYSAGRVGLLTVLDSAREALMRQVDLAQHLAAQGQRRAELERALGGSLEVRQ
jgi:cobalt-zinc-cadmium efflux system outer membrane protein